MLQRIHDRVQGWIAWVLIILIAITFTLFGINYYLESRQINNVVKEVNGQAITKEELRVTYQRLRQQQENRMGERFILTPSVDKQLNEMAMEQLILSKVVLQAARKSGYNISQQQAENALFSIPQFQQDGEFSQEKFQQYINAAQFTPQSFVQQIKDGMLNNQQRFTFMGTSFALRDDIQQYVRLIDQSRNYQYLSVSADQFKNNISISETAVKDYYQKHIKDYMNPEKLRVDYITLSMKDLMSKISVSNQEIDNYYQENLDNYRSPARWTVAHILLKLPQDSSQQTKQALMQKAEKIEQELQQGASFKQMVTKYSDDILSKANGGVMPSLLPGTMGDAYDQQLIALKKPGQLSPPFETPYGIEILKLIRKDPPKQLPLSEVKPQIKTLLLADKAQKLFSEKSDALSDLVYQNPDSLQAAADKLGLTVHTTPWFTANGGSEEVTKNSKVIQAAFSSDVLQEGNNSQPIQLNSDAIVVLRVNQHQKSQAKPFSEVEEKIKKKLVLSQVKNKTKQYGDALVTDLRRGKPLPSQDLKWTEVKDAKRNQNQPSMVINQQAFRLPHPSDNIKMPVAGLSLDNGDYVIVRLTQVKNGAIKDINKEQKDIYRNQIEAALGVADYDLYVQSLMKSAKVES